MKQQIHHRDRTQLWVRFHAQGWALETDEQILGYFPTEDAAIDAGLAMLEQAPDQYQICVEDVEEPGEWEPIPLPARVPEELIVALACLAIGLVALLAALALNS